MSGFGLQSEPRGHAARLLCCIGGLFGAKCGDGILLCGDAGRNQTGDEGQQHADANQNERTCNGELSAQDLNTRDGMEDQVDGNQ